MRVGIGLLVLALTLSACDRGSTGQSIVVFEGTLTDVELVEKSSGDAIVPDGTALPAKGARVSVIVKD